MCFCNNSATEEMTMITFDDLEHLKIKLYNSYKLNPFHNYTAKMQSNLLKDFNNRVAKKQTNLEDYFLSYKSFEPHHRTLLVNAIKLHKGSTFIKTHSETIFLNLLMFMLSNTKNNAEKKLEVINIIINECEEKTKKMDLERLKISIKSLIKTSLSLLKYCVLLPVFIEGEDNLSKFLQNKYEGNIEDEAYNKSKVPELIFHHITKLLRREYTYQNLIEKWENFVLAPYIFAGYSNKINIDSYNLELKEELIRRMLYLFDGRIVIDTFLNMDIAE